MHQKLRILIATDFSDDAQNAADYALFMFENSLAELILLNTYETPGEGNAILISIGDILEDNSRKLVEREKARIIAKNSTVAVNTLTWSGKVLTSIQRVLRDFTIDLIVVGMKGNSEADAERVHYSGIPDVRYC